MYKKLSDEECAGRHAPYYSSLKEKIFERFDNLPREEKEHLWYDKMLSYRFHIKTMIEISRIEISRENSIVSSPNGEGRG